LKKKAKHKSHETEGDFKKVRLPRKNDHEMFALVTKLHGVNKISALFEDGVERKCRITGKMKKKIWIREGDLIIGKIWDFQPSKADVVWRYLGDQTNRLKRLGYLEKLPV
jgi:translation initiation factor 1A